MTHEPSTLSLDFPGCLADDFARELPAAQRAVERVVQAARESASFAALEERSPGLKGNDWSNYLRCSMACMVHAANALARRGVTGGRVLDYGSYFGNFALMFRDLGYDVDAIDFFKVYDTALSPILKVLDAEGIRALDFEQMGRNLAGVPAGTYDVVLCMGVVEHIPDTPRPLLEALDRVLKPGGVLLVETPNLAHLYNRQKLARGEAIMTPLDVQDYATPPFQGHHREYTIAEVVWMAEQIHHEVLLTDLYNYSAYGQGTLTGRDVTNHWRMVADPTLREIILVVSRKPMDPGAPVPPADWSRTFEDVEHYWRRRAPSAQAPESADAIVATERLLVELQDGVRVRDGMLKDLQDGRTHDVGVRDTEIAALNERLGALQQRFDRTPGERLKRAIRRLTGGAS